MGFPGLSPKIGKTPEEIMLEKQIKAQKENMLVESASNPGDDQIYYQEKGDKADLMRWQQDLGDELIRLKFRLRSMREDETGKWCFQYIDYPERDQFGRTKKNPITGQIITHKIRVPPLANDLFIDMVETEVGPFLSRNLLNSNFTESRLLGMIRRTMDDIVDNMADNWDVYDIDFKNYDIITRLIKNVIMPGPYRALNDGERKHQRTINKRIESFAESGKPRPTSTIEGIFGRRE